MKNYSKNILLTIKGKIPLARSAEKVRNLSANISTIPGKIKFSGHFGLKSLLFLGKVQNLTLNNYLIINY